MQTSGLFSNVACARLSYSTSRTRASAAVICHVCFVFVQQLVGLAVVLVPRLRFVWFVFLVACRLLVPSRDQELCYGSELQGDSKTFRVSSTARQVLMSYRYQLFVLVQCSFLRLFSSGTWLFMVNYFCLCILHFATTSWPGM